MPVFERRHYTLLFCHKSRALGCMWMTNALHVCIQCLALHRTSISPKVTPMAANKTRALRLSLRLQAALSTAPHWHGSINKIVRLKKALCSSVTQKCYIECDP